MHFTIKTFPTTALGLFAALALMGVTAPARADSASDNFRERVVGASVVCYGVFSRLAVEEWPGRDYAEVAELQSDARQKRDFTMSFLTRYTANAEDFDIDAELANADAISGSQTMSREKLLDLAIFCEDKIFDLIDEEEQNGYTP